jgi:hypothetical protein
MSLTAVRQAYDPGPGGDPRTAADSWLPSVRGHLALTSDHTGLQAGPLRTYTPYGDPLTTVGTTDPDAIPDNQPGQLDLESALKPGWTAEPAVAHLRRRVGFLGQEQ